MNELLYAVLFLALTFATMLMWLASDAMHGHWIDTRRFSRPFYYVSVLHNKVPVLLLVAIWFAATQHCGIENLGLFAGHAEDTPAAGCCKSTDDSCSRDGCDTVENGSYKPDRDHKLVTPQFVACACQLCLKSIVPPEPPDGNVLRRDFERSDAGAPIWQFVRRAALPARAPSLSLA